MTARMTPAEAVVLCRFAKACCPQQAFDEYTPDAWFELLGDLRFEDCKLALTKVVQNQPFVSPAEIRSAVKKIRTNRCLDFGDIVPPPEIDPDDIETWRRWHEDIYRRIGDGELTREQYDREQAALGRTDTREVPALDAVLRDANSDDPWATGEAS